LCPPNCGLSKDSRENRWRVRAPYLHVLGLGNARSRAWGREGCEWEALLVVVRLAWTAYAQETAAEVPFEFQD